MKYTFSNKDPLATYPGYAVLIYAGLGSMVRMLASVKEHENVPSMYPSIRGLTETFIKDARKNLPMFKEQIESWQKLVLTEGQQYDIDSLHEILLITEQIYDKGFEMASELSQELIDKLQKMDPTEIAKLVWEGEIKLPKIEINNH